jgi:hypothetical protein
VTILKEMSKEKAKKYIVSIEKVLSGMEFTSGQAVDEEHVRSVIDAVHSYAEDARYYLQDQPSTALTAISYAEGLLDALRFLGLAKFTWPDRRDGRP